MFKKITLLIMLFLSITTMSSCNLMKMENHPTKFPMSKWEGGGIELYILDQEINNSRDLILIHVEDRTLAFDVIWHGNGLWDLDVRDRRIPIPAGELDPLQELLFDYHRVGSFELKIRNRESCLLIPDRYFPEGLFPDKGIVLKCTATNLSPEDIPTINTIDSYASCPAYYYGSQWISEDEKVSITISSDVRSDGEGKITYTDEPNQDKKYVVFTELDSCAYIGVSSDLKLASEKWKCEYYEDYFIATVIHSDHFESGQILRFSRTD